MWNNEEGESMSSDVRTWRVPFPDVKFIEQFLVLIEELGNIPKSDKRSRMMKVSEIYATLTLLGRTLKTDTISADMRYLMEMNHIRFDRNVHEDEYDCIKLIFSIVGYSDDDVEQMARKLEEKEKKA